MIPGHKQCLNRPPMAIEYGDYLLDNNFMLRGFDKAELSKGLHSVQTTT